MERPDIAPSTSPSSIARAVPVPWLAVPIARPFATGFVILKKFKAFAGKPAPFVMELPTYKIPSLKGVLLHTWEKVKGFLKKASTIILALSLIFLRSGLYSVANFNGSVCSFKVIK